VSDFEVNVDFSHGHRVGPGDFVFFCPGVDEKVDARGENLTQCDAATLVESRGDSRQVLKVHGVSETVVQFAAAVWVIQGYRSTRKRERERFAHPRLTWTLLEPKAWVTLYGSRTP
jgi:hypothetical protein